MQNKRIQFVLFINENDVKIFPKFHLVVTCDIQGQCVKDPNEKSARKPREKDQVI